MKRNKNILGFATGLLPASHERYREMCSLAAVGQLGGPEMCELNEHISACNGCRKFLEEVAHASIQVLPLLAGERIAPSAVPPPVGMRARFLSRLEAEPTRRNQHFGAVDLGEGDVHERPSQEVRTEIPGAEHKPGTTPTGARVWRLAAGIAAGSVLALSGYYAGKRLNASPTPTVSVSGSRNLTAPPNSMPVRSDRLDALTEQRTALLAELTDVKGKLSVAASQQKELGLKLSEANGRLSTLEKQGEATASASLSESRQAQNQIALLESEIDALRKQSDDSKVRLVSAQKDNDDLRSKLELTETNLQEELAMKDAKSQMGDLVAARNLHIVDVYDADPNGKRQRAFGRVFYTEGKSLVFYAYDLEDGHPLRSNIVFHVWGGKAGVKEVTHSLGILNKDDDGQSRWKMTFDDPHVLSQINTVFVTAETSGKSLDSPRGKKVLFAYFGSAPNHP